MESLGQLPVAASRSAAAVSHTGPPPPYQRMYRAKGTLERYAFDRDYVTRLARGDAATEAHFSRYFGDLLLIKLRSRLRSAEFVEDARQETFTRVLNHLRNKGGIEFPERLGAFVNSVCEIVLLESFRATSRFQQVPENAVEAADKAASAESLFISAERQALLRKILLKLSGEDQKILRKVFLEERDKDAVCQDLGIGRDYLRVRIHRALGRCRSALKKG
jgi:RNA polymerase sigma-70 factor, ECF subfamily